MMQDQPWEQSPTVAFKDWLFGTPLTIVSHIMCLMSVFGAVWVGHKYRGGFAASAPLSFNWHPVLMSLAFAFFMAQGVIVYRTWTGRRATAKIIHWTFMFLAALCAIVGLYAVFTFHNALKIDNMYSAHSWLGITTCIFFFVQLCIGIPAYLLRILSPEVRATLLPVHAFLGATTFMLAFATMALGWAEKQSFQNKSGSKFQDASMFMGGLMIWVVLTGVVVAAHIAFGGRRKSGGAVVDENEKGLLSHSH